MSLARISDLDQIQYLNNLISKRSHQIMLHTRCFHYLVGRSCVHRFVCSVIRSFICSFVCLFVRSLIVSFTDCVVHLFVRSFVL